MAKKWNPTAQKILLLLSGGLALGLSGSPRRYYRIVGAMAREWKAINEGELKENIRKLYRSKFVWAKENKDGTSTLTITKKGKELALVYDIDNLTIKSMKKWDGKWRVLLSDIPEGRRKERDAVRLVLQRAGFLRYQKSVFVHPFECQNEIDFVVEFFNLRPWVRVIVADSLDNELHLKKHFGLI